MGWSSGSSLFSDIIAVVSENVHTKNVRKRIYSELITIFEDRDCDTLDECLEEDAAFDEAYFELYPDLLEEDE